MNRLEAALIVVGAGAAGLAAAIAASEAGARTIVLDKAPDISDTNTSRSGGSVTIALERERYLDAPRLSAEEKVEEALSLTEGAADPELVRTWRENVDDMIQWLSRAGLKWGKGYSSDPPVKNRRTALGYGPGLNKQLLAIAHKKGCAVHFDARAEKLLVDGAGKVSGVRVRTVEGLREFQAGAAILATGGFQANQEMLLKYFGPQFGPDFAYKVRLTGSPFSTGDGLLMAQELGAKLVNLDQCHSRNIDSSWVPGSPAMRGPYRELQYPLVHYSIWVNKWGQRFMDEGNTSDSAANSILVQPGMEVAYIFDEKIKRLKPELVAGFQPAEVLFTGASLDEIAIHIGVDVEALKRTIEEYNQAVRTGRAMELGVPKKDFLMPIDTPPFYAVHPVWAGLNCTMGGPKINAKAQVMDRDDVPIPGLFACGEMIGGFFSGKYHKTPAGTSYYIGNYQITASSLTTCLVFARIAGTNAASWSRTVAATEL
ncbi:MAG: FAD-dependent oxidoreductase [Chloroflexi bacterium]|nr:FAD-dependent oxidoreductase [Chloroflexota bacterium]